MLLNITPGPGQPSTTENCQGQNINSGEFAKPWPTGISTHPHHWLSFSSLVASPSLLSPVYPQAIFLRILKSSIFIQPDLAVILSVDNARSFLKLLP